MILTDLFGEDISANVHVLYIPNSDKIEDITGHIRPGSKDFSQIDICFVSVGHHNLHTWLGQFIRDFKCLLNALRVHNSKMFLFIMSVLPIGPNPELHKFAVIKSQQLNENFNKKPDISYVNLFSSLSIQGEIPPEFLRNHKLNKGGIKYFFNKASKAILAM